MELQPRGAAARRFAPSPPNAVGRAPDTGLPATRARAHPSLKAFVAPELRQTHPARARPNPGRDVLAQTHFAVCVRRLAAPGGAGRRRTLHGQRPARSKTSSLRPRVEPAARPHGLRHGRAGRAGVRPSWPPAQLASGTAGPKADGPSPGRSGVGRALDRCCHTETAECACLYQPPACSRAVPALRALLGPALRQSRAGCGTRAGGWLAKGQPSAANEPAAAKPVWLWRRSYCRRDGGDMAGERSVQRAGRLFSDRPTIQPVAELADYRVQSRPGIESSVPAPAQLAPGDRQRRLPAQAAPGTGGAPVPLLPQRRLSRRWLSRAG